LLLTFSPATSTPTHYTLSLHDALPIYNDILITWDCPFCPSIRRFCLAITFHSSQIQAFAEAVLPGLKRAGKIRHGAPDSHKLPRSEEHTSELQSRFDLVCRLLLEKKNA